MAVLERLLPKVDINQPRSSEDNETLLHIAINNTRVECVELLSKKGASLEVLTKKSWYNKEPFLPIHLAVKRDSAVLVTLLLDNGADIHSAKSGTPALIFTRSIEMATLLLDRGANLHACNAEGQNVLFFNEYRSYDVTKLYIDRGCNVNAVCKKGMTPLMKAVIQVRFGSDSHPNEEKFSTLNYFLEKGAEINATDLQGNTAMHLLFCSGYIGHKDFQLIELLTLLLANGADPLITNNDGESPRDKVDDYYNPKCQTYRTIRDFFLDAEEEAKRNPGFKRPRLESYYPVPSSPPSSSSSSSSSSSATATATATGAVTTSADDDEENQDSEESDGDED